MGPGHNAGQLVRKVFSGMAEEQQMKYAEAEPKLCWKCNSYIFFFSNFSQLVLPQTIYIPEKKGRDCALQISCPTWEHRLCKLTRLHLRFTSLSFVFSSLDIIFQSKNIKKSVMIYLLRSKSIFRIVDLLFHQPLCINKIHFFSLFFFEQV